MSLQQRRTPARRLLNDSKEKVKAEGTEYAPTSKERANVRFIPSICIHHSSFSQSTPLDPIPPLLTFNLVHLSFQEKAATPRDFTIYGVVGALVLVTGWGIAKELMPVGQSPNKIFSATFDKIRKHPELTARLGSPLKAYGRDLNTKREGRRNFIDHDFWTE